MTARPRPGALPVPDSAGTLSPMKSPLRLAAFERILLSSLLVACAAQTAGAFGLEDVVQRARKLAASAYADPRGGVPQWLLDLNYDQYRDIRFRPERALWRDRDLPFSLQFFHPGFYYDRAVSIHVVSRSGAVSPVAFSPDQFDYGRNKFESRIPQDLGYAGFRIHYPIKSTSYHDEVAAFLGASYFRAVGRDQVYGLSARGVAIDTALSSGEEFPWFREFWLVQPAPGASELTLFALLDSPSATGAYRFVVAPGAQTRVDVEMHLFPRRTRRRLREPARRWWKASSRAAISRTGAFSRSWGRCPGIASCGPPSRVKPTRTAPSPSSMARPSPSRTSLR